MQRFGKISSEELDGDQVHRLENVITLWDAVRLLFDQLRIWFEPSVSLFEAIHFSPLTCKIG